jgi:RNA polymerase sigma-70 factor (ECF subfamily)
MQIPRDPPDPGADRSDPVDAFAHLYDAEMPRVYNYFRYHVGSVEDAEDLTSEVFHRALRHWNRVRKKLRSPRAWLFSIATNRLTDHYRRKHNRPAFQVEAAADIVCNNSGPEEMALQKESVGDLMNHLSELADRDRQIVTLRFAAGLSHREIGRVLRISEGASAVALLRVLRRLRQSYRGEDR